MSSQTCTEHAHNGCQARESATPRSIRLASRGVRTVRDIGRFACAAACDIMTGKVDSLEAVRAGSLFGLGLRARLDERLTGEVAVIDDGLDDEAADPLAAEEARLLEQLASVRKERATH